jgi:hypothetical protein
VAGIRIPRSGHQVIFLDEAGRTAGKQWACYGVRIRVKIGTDNPQIILKQVANCNTLADVNVAKWVYMYPSWFAQVFVQSLGKLLPGVQAGSRGKDLRSPAAVHHPAFSRWELPLGLSCTRFLGLGYANRPYRNA